MQNAISSASSAASPPPIVGARSGESRVWSQSPFIRKTRSYGNRAGGAGAATEDARDIIDAMDVFAHRDAIQIPVAHQFLHPHGKAVVELELEDDAGHTGVEPARGLQRVIVISGGGLAVEGDAHLFVDRRQPRLALVIDDDFR